MFSVSAVRTAWDKGPPPVTRQASEGAGTRASGGLPGAVADVSENSALWWECPGQVQCVVEQYSPEPSSGEDCQARSHCPTSYPDCNFDPDAVVCGPPAGRSGRKDHGVDKATDAAGRSHIRANFGGGESLAAMALKVPRNGDERPGRKCLGEEFVAVGGTASSWRARCCIQDAVGAIVAQDRRTTFAGPGEEVPGAPAI